MNLQGRLIHSFGGDIGKVVEEFPKHCLLTNVVEDSIGRLAKTNKDVVESVGTKIINRISANPVFGKVIEGASKLGIDSVVSVWVATEMITKAIKWLKGGSAVAKVAGAAPRSEWELKR